MRVTDALVSPPAAVGGPSNQAAWNVAAAALPRAVAGLATASCGAKTRVTAHDVRRALEGGATHDDPFAWSTRTAQRTLGLAALESLLFGSSRSPADAVREVVSEASRRSHGGNGLDRWMSDLPPAGRAAVGAAAVTWATRLWSAVDWDALATPLLIGRDHWWSSPHSLLCLRSRAEVRCGTANLVLLTGARRHTAHQELSLVMLVEALRAGEDQRPVPVIGWWPDSGRLVRVDPEPAALDMGLASLGAVLRSRRHQAA
jgi:hypothetical protein